jgi:hypothetical protein
LMDICLKKIVCVCHWVLYMNCLYMKHMRIN